MTPTKTPPPQPQIVGALDTLAAAWKAHVEAVDAYNARREYVHSLPIDARFNLDAEYRAMTVTQGAFLRTAQDVAKARLEAGAPPAIDQSVATADANTGEALAGLITGASSHARGSGSGRPLTPADQMVAGKFSLGARVRKTKGSSWQGRIVGFYSTELTPIGYAVESEREPGSVQIYPEAALAKLEDQP